MDLRMSLQLVGCGHASNCPGVAAGADVVPYCNAGACSSAVWTASSGALGAPTFPTLGVKDMAACKSDYAVAASMWLLAERALVVCAFVDDREGVIVEVWRRWSGMLPDRS